MPQSVVLMSLLCLLLLQYWMETVSGCGHEMLSRGCNCPHTIPVVTIGFRETDYSVTEGAPSPDQYPKFKLARDKEIVQPL